MTSTAPPYHLSQNPSETSLRAPTLPPYSEHAGSESRDEDIELASLTPSTSSSSSSTTPAAAAAAASSSSKPTKLPSHTTFTPTQHLQIQTPGKDLLSSPTPPRPDPIPIFSLTPTGALSRPLYLSIRPQLRSGTCFLAHGDDETQTPLTTTTYRFGPGRPPVVVLGDPAITPPTSTSTEPEGTGTPGFEITSRNIFSRAVTFTIPDLGTFTWRYGNSNERAVVNADNLLICEVVLPPSTTPSSSPSPSTSTSHNNKNKASRSARLNIFKSERESESKHQIAQLIRNAEFRTPGTTRSTAGNGGRLALDLAVFDEKRRERVEWLVVTTAVTMLKREVDRRRGEQIVILTG